MDQFLGKPVRNFPARFWGKVEKTESCWIWNGTVSDNGYGRIGIYYVTYLAHRVSWLLSGRHIPAGYDLDHLCRNKRRVNPDHLEAVTHRENVLRGEAGLHMHAKQALRLHCMRGHAFTPENTRWRAHGKQKMCRICMRAQKAAARARKNGLACTG